MYYKLHRPLPRNIWIQQQLKKPYPPKRSLPRKILKSVKEVCWNIKEITKKYNVKFP